MVNVNNIVIDLGAQTATLTITNASSAVDTIVYSNSSNTVQFSPRYPLTISGADFLNMVAQFLIFQQAILTNFAANIFATTPFTEQENVETNNTSTWGYYSVNGYSPIGRTLDYTATQSGQTVTLNNREFTITLNFSEWVYMLQSLIHYNASVQVFLSL